jgi:sodium-dependent dicarboxylate transporter 2/3/5
MRVYTSYHEYTMLVLFASLVFLWMTRDPKIVCGWGCLFPGDYVTDGASAMFMATLLFVLPRHMPGFVRCGTGTADTYEPLLRWSQVQHRLSWGTVLLLGGGYALADGVSVGANVYVCARTHIRRCPAYRRGCVAV